jgi:hypothetical protein
MATGRRCPIGCFTWPDDEKYRVCPECGDETTRFRGVQPLDEEQATMLRWEAFYREWDEKMPGVRLEMTPEQSLRWDALYPNGRPSLPDSEDG